MKIDFSCLARARCRPRDGFDLLAVACRRCRRRSSRASRGRWLMTSLLVLGLTIGAAPSYAQTCGTLQPVLNPNMTGGTNWTRVGAGLQGDGSFGFTATGFTIDDNMGGNVVAVPTTPNRIEQNITGGMAAGTIIEFVPRWNNAGDFNGRDGNRIQLSVAYGGVIYAQFNTSSASNAFPAPSQPAGPTTNATFGAANGATLAPIVGSGNGWATVTPATQAFGGARYRLTLPAGVPSAGMLSFQVRRLDNHGVPPSNATDDLSVSDLTVTSPTLCLRKINATTGVSTSFDFTTTNLDTNLGTTAVDSTATITTAAQNTPVPFDAWTGADARATGITPMLVVNRVNPIVIGETDTGYGTTAIDCTGITGTPAINLATRQVTLPANAVTTGTDAACTFTNARPRVRLQKVLAGDRLDAADQFALNIAGPSNGTATNITVNTTGAGSATAGTADLANADAGGTYVLSEAMAAGSASVLGSYRSQIACTNANAGSATILPNGEGTSFDLANLVAADDITCTFTNTPRTATLTLRKQWSGAEVGDDATITVSRGATVIDTFNSDAGAAGELDADATPTAVVIGETLTLAETLATANVGLYDDTLACTGSADTDPADGLTIGAADTSIVCTYSNTRRVADLSITKTNTPTVGALDQANDTVDSGQATTYTLVVTNDGATAVTGAVVRDAPGAGITCPAGNAVTISGDGVPAGSFTVGDLTGSTGIVLGVLAAGQRATLSFNCQVN
ncbi:DUF11 domain-containing protein [Lysobacter capsici]|uniref:DUF11 domain-containing protein n=2 Tax=Lysobacter TaxID=68 RepID=UPI001F1DBE0B|nr:DUF11 domain-containing protein [Lysobacter capsici]UJB21726.1 DUF11 domain-containing protein [Lysobacter capsici]